MIHFHVVDRVFAGSLGKIVEERALRQRAVWLHFVTLDYFAAVFPVADIEKLFVRRESEAIGAAGSIAAASAAEAIAYLRSGMYCCSFNLYVR